MRTVDIKFNELCDEIDYWKSEADHWKSEFEKERDSHIELLNDSIERSRKGIGQALALALVVRDNPDGSLSISKEDRESLAKNLKEV